VRTEILEQHSELITEMCKIAGERANELKNKDESIQTFSWRYHLEPSDVKLWLSETNWNYTMDFTKDSFENTISVLNQLKLIEPDALTNWKNVLFS
jgi:hypothetical protein